MTAEAGHAGSNGARAALVERIRRHFGEHRLDGHLVEWRQLDDGTAALVVDGGSVMFNLAGEDLHVTGPVPGGQVHCAVIEADGTHRRTFVADDPFSAEQAALN